MIRTFASAAIALLGVSMALADEPEIAPRVMEDRVDSLLREWADRSTKIKSMYAEFERVQADDVWNMKKPDKVEKGQARFLSPSKARLDIEKVESHVLTGEGELWEYKLDTAQITIYELPESVKQDNLQDDGPLPFLFGSNPDKAKSRYRFTVLVEDDKIVHVRIDPKLQADQNNFEWAEIWLDKKNFVPARLQFHEPNGNRVTFNFKKIYTNIEINPQDFSPKLIKGWKVVRKKETAPVANDQAAVSQAAPR